MKDYFPEILIEYTYPSGCKYLRSFLDKEPDKLLKLLVAKGRTLAKSNPVAGKKFGKWINFLNNNSLRDSNYKIMGLFIIGASLIQTGMIEKGLESLEKAFDEAKSDYPELIPEILIEQSTGYLFTRDYVKAEKVLSDAEILVKKENKKDLSGKILINKAGILFQQRRLEESLSCLARSEKILRDCNDDINLAVIYRNRGNIFFFMARYKEALLDYEKAKTIFDNKKLELLSGRLARRMGLDYLYLGDYVKSAKAFDDSINIFNKLGLKIETALSEFNKSNLYFGLNLYNDANELLLKSIPVFSKSKLANEYAFASVNQGIALTGLGKYKEANLVLRKAKGIFKKLKDEFRIAETTLYEAFLLHRLGKHKQVLKKIEEIKSTCKGKGFMLEYFEACLLEGEVFLLRGLFDNSERSFRKILNEAKKYFTPSIEFRGYLGLGKCLFGEGKLKKAYNALKKGVDILETLRERMIPEDFSRTAFQQDKNEIYEAIIDVCLKMGGPSMEPRVLEYIQRSKSRSLLELTRQKMNIEPEFLEGDKKKLYEEYCRLRKTIDEKYAELENGLNYSNGHDKREFMLKNDIKIKEYEHRLHKTWRKLLEPAHDHTKEDYGAYERITDNALSKLPENTAILDYFFHGDRLLILAIDSDIMKLVDVDINYQDVEKLVEEIDFFIRQYYLDQKFVKKFETFIAESGKGILRSCFDLFIKPALQYIKGKENLIIIPHKILYHLPFSIFMEGSKYMLEDYCISYIPNFQWFENIKYFNRLKEKGTIFGYAGESLTHIDKEIEQIKNVFPESSSFTGVNATRKCFSKKAHLSQWLHIACHGKFRQDNPFLSGFLLADGWITYQDIISMDLKAEVVTMSACETGRCEVLKGDEFIGLIRSFLASNVKSVVSSLFKVQDEVTCRLIGLFYKNLKDGLSVSKSLQLAQKEIMKNWKSPYYWGGFQVYGDLFRNSKEI